VQGGTLKCQKEEKSVGRNTEVLGGTVKCREEQRRVGRNGDMS